MVVPVAYILCILDQHFSNSDVHTNHLGALLQVRFWFGSLGAS